MDLQERDTSYHRRLALISSFVIAATSLFVVASQRYVHREDPMVGWKGEMELLPELSVLPDFVATDNTPKLEDRGKNSSMKTAVTSAKSEFQVAAPQTEKNPLDLEALGTASHAARASRPVSYSETYVILRMVEPKYPPDARDAGIEGSVTVELLIDEQGLVAQAYVLHLAGPQSFEDAALEAVRQFVFQPPIVDGEVSTMWIKFIYTFRLK
jgi:TonB family protein